MTFRVGQKVVCINCDVMLGLIKPSDVLTIVQIRELPFGPSLFFAEVEAPAPYVGFFQECFRPAVDKKTEISVFNEILREATRTKEIVASGTARDRAKCPAVARSNLRRVA